MKVFFLKLQPFMRKEESKKWPVHVLGFFLPSLVPKKLQNPGGVYMATSLTAARFLRRRGQLSGGAEIRSRGLRVMHCMKRGN